MENIDHKRPLGEERCTMGNKEDPNLQGESTEGKAPSGAPPEDDSPLTIAILIAIAILIFFKPYWANDASENH